MPCTTFYSEYEREQLRHCDIKELDELLGELRAATGEDWFIRKFTFTVGYLWWKREIARYSLYLAISGDECQIINFAWTGKECSINMRVDAHSIMNFVMGYLNGVNYKTAKPEGVLK